MYNFNQSSLQIQQKMKRNQRSTKITRQLKNKNSSEINKQLDEDITSKNNISIPTPIPSYSET
ncbi:hypothetical protein HZS_5125 [Henneguya salminicola]|nr:hypothetical protein HZS_5125 [Henneguya salminicola]